MDKEGEHKPRMEAYNESLINYRRTLDFVSGTGARGQGYIDAAYEKLSRLTLR